MGLLDFLKKDEYKSGNDAGQGQTQPVNLGQQPPTQSPLLPGSAPAPIPSSNPAPAQVPNNNQFANATNSQAQPQIQPYETNSAQGINPNMDSNTGQDNNGFQPLQESPVNQPSMDVPVDDFTPLQQAGYSPSGVEEETIFGEGDLADIYTQKFPDPQNIQPTVPGQVDPASAAPDFNTNFNQTSQDMSQGPESIETGSPMSMNQNPGAATDQNTHTQQIMPEMPQPELQNEVTKSTDQGQVDNSPVQNTQKVETGSQFSVPKFDMDAIMASTQKAIDATKQKPVNGSDSAGQINSADDIPKAEPIDVTPVSKEIDSKEEPKVEENNKEVLKPKAKAQRNVFSKIGVLGLDGPNMNSLDSEGVIHMAKNLLENKTELIFGTDKGIVPKILTGLKNPKFRISTVSLQPILAVEGSEKVNAASHVNNFAIVYSNFIEWLRHIIKESRMFIVFDGAGLINHTMLLNLISISKTYGENGKPIILIGESWKAKIDTLKKNSVFADADMSNISILNNTDELQSKLDELNAKYSQNKEPQYARVVDRRVEGDEKEFTVY